LSHIFLIVISSFSCAQVSGCLVRDCERKQVIEKAKARQQEAKRRYNELREASKSAVGGANKPVSMSTYDIRYAARGQRCRSTVSTQPIGKSLV
jgi:hypothetical protein